MASRAARPTTTYMSEGVELMIFSLQAHTFPHSYTKANPTQSWKVTIL